MKWYWIVLIVLTAIVIGYAIASVRAKNSSQKLPPGVKSAVVTAQTNADGTTTTRTDLVTDNGEKSSQIKVAA